MDITGPHSTHLCTLMAVLATSRPLPFTCPRWGAGAGLGRTRLRASQTPYRCSLRRGRAVRAQVWCGAPAAGECAAVSRGGDTHCADSWRDGSLSAHGKMWRLLDVDTPLMMLLLLLCVYFPLGPGWRRPASLLLTCSVKKKEHVSDAKLTSTGRRAVCFILPKTLVEINNQIINRTITSRLSVFLLMFAGSCKGERRKMLYLRDITMI